MKRYCYSTLLGTDDYLGGVLGLHFSLQNVNSKYPLIVIVPDTISSESIKILDDNNVQYRIFPDYSLSENIMSPNFRSTMNKLHCLSFEDYDRVFFLDGDAVAIRNLDIHLELDGFVGVQNWMGVLSGAVFIIDTNKELAETIFKKYMHVQTDEQVLNYYFLKNVMDNNNYLFERNFIYHIQGLEGKYWKIYNLDTPAKIKKFIDNSWILALEINGYFQDPQRNVKYIDLINKVFEEINQL